MLQVGDVVIVHKPENVMEKPYWVPEMDSYDGKECIVSSVVLDIDGGFYRVKVEGDTYYFRDTWMTLAEDEKELEDEDLLKFISEFAS